MDNLVKVVILFFIATFLLTSCANEELIPFYQEQKAGKIVIRGYNALQDSIQITVNNKLLTADKKHDAFIKKVEKDFEFVFYDNEIKTVQVTNKKTKELIYSQNFTTQKAVDTLSFYMKENLLVTDFMSDKPGTLSAAGLTGYRFIFPNINKYSKSGYTGPIDAVIRKINGQIVGVSENINKNKAGSFVEFTFSLPPIIEVELVKHGTSESYVSSQRIAFRTVMQKNKSGIVVLEETANADNSFARVEGMINLADYFSF
ncbi:hypothetical protein [Flavobacterium sp. HTF]|uniref:hypothetical protein n=1 Tax=Flavobacterium sp. HTF TaxID=2170732 RepID=UPI000D5DA556|nr:hypothetical protein [Flavobacterium sp. HTF]PWB27676.1 hypothetical protein DCO46_02660 [Flavobacterium sp. HTF]